MNHLQEILVDISKYKYIPAMYHSLQTYYFEAQQLVLGIEAQNHIANAQMIMHQETIEDTSSKEYSVEIAKGEIKSIQASAFVASLQYNRIKHRRDILARMLEALDCTVAYEVAFLYELGLHDLPKPPLETLINICSEEDPLVKSWAPKYLASLDGDESNE